jgi:type I restriction enzyme S subunit
MVVPETWNLCDIGSLADIYSGATPSTNNPAFWNGDIVWVTPSDITDQQTKYLTSSERRINLEGLRNCSAALLPKGTILLCTRATIGVMSIADKEVATNQGFKNLICNKDTSNEFVYYALQMLKDEMVGKSIGTTFLELSKSELSKIKMLVPKDKEEQTAIAEVLSDADSLITSLEELIAKKKSIKQGAMHELLTGKKRLPGFSGEWHRFELEHVADFQDNLRIPIAESLREKGKIPYYGANGIQDYVKGFTHDGEFVLVAEDGANDLSNYPVKYVKGKIWVNNHAHVIQGKAEKADTQFLAYSMSMIDYQTILVGGTRAKLNGSVLRKITILIPDRKEQSAIATILSDMDAEIEQLEKKLAKYRLIKQGMMQELLTGRIRLIESNKKAETVPKGRNQQYDDAIAISAIVNAFYDDRFILGRVKVQKLLYLLRRKQDADVSDFKKKAAGPYNEKARYKGGESIAIKNGYIIVERNSKGSKFSKGSSIDVALKYVGNMQSEIDWLLEKFRFYNTSKNTKNLEVLATVDMAVCELEKNSKVVNLDAVKNLIRSNKEWASKLTKPFFIDAAINHAIMESKELFGQEV